MPIPGLNALGFLPPGIHDCILDEVMRRFGGFQVTDRRCRLAEKLREYVAELRAAGLVRAVMINGSFVTAKSIPEDVDLILALHDDYDESADLLPFQYQTLSRRQARKRYGFDVLAARENSGAYATHLQFFQQVRGLPRQRKGLLRVEL